MKQKIEVLVAYHKPAPIYNTDIFNPIHVGAALSEIDLGITCDNEGDNISERNINYAEMTAVYWAWKNSKADYIGLFHYRRFLDFSDSSDEPFFTLNALEPDLVERLKINSEYFLDNYADYDIITRKREDLRVWSNYTVYEHYRDAHQIEHVSLARKIIERDHKNTYLKYFDKVFNGHISFFTNMFIMKRNVFNEYCEWIFPILEEVYSSENLYKISLSNNSNDARFIGYLAERLTSIFIFKSLETLRVKELPAVILLEDTTKKWFEYNTYASSTKMIESKYKTKIKEAALQKDEPIVSVLVAVYNTSNFLRQALDSVFSQTLSNIEIIAVNDGSTDESLSILKEYETSDTRLRIINKENEGLGFARNDALKQAKGKYVHFMDSDDYMEPKFLEMMVAKAEDNSSEVVISLHRAFDNTTGKTLLSSTLPYSILGITGTTNVHECPDILLSPCHVWDKLFLRSFVANFSFSKYGGEDIPFFYFWALNAKRVSFFKSILYNYRVDINSVQAKSSYALGVFKSLDIVQDKFNDGTYDKSFEPYFDIFKIALIGHTHYRTSQLLLNDKSFRKQYFHNIKKVLMFDLSPDSDIYKKLSYYHGDHERIISIKNMGYSTWNKYILNRRFTNLVKTIINKLLPYNTFRRKVARKIYRTIKTA